MSTDIVLFTYVLTLSSLNLPLSFSSTTSREFKVGEKLKKIVMYW